KIGSNEAKWISSICRRLNGIPLAIELAAPRVRHLSLDKIANRLDACLAILTDGPRTAPRRQQELQLLMDWSYALLKEPEKIVLRRLSAFVGGATLDAIETVCSC